METEYQKLIRCVETVKAKIHGFQPEVALTLGSGLGHLGEKIEVKYTVRYEVTFVKRKKSLQAQNGHPVNAISN